MPHAYAREQLVFFLTLLLHPPSCASMADTQDVPRGGWGFSRRLRSGAWRSLDLARMVGPPWYELVFYFLLIQRHKSSAHSLNTNTNNNKLEVSHGIICEKM